MKIRHLLPPTLLSILIFFTIQFFSVFSQLGTPWHERHPIKFEIGFPYKFYMEFMVDPPAPNLGWNLDMLILDCFIIWVAVVGCWFLWKRLQLSFR